MCHIQGIDQRLQEVSSEEVPFQPGFQASDLRSLLSTSVNHCEKRLSELHARIMKQLRGDTELADLVRFSANSKVFPNPFALTKQLRHTLMALSCRISGRNAASSGITAQANMRKDDLLIRFTTPSTQAEHFEILLLSCMKPGSLHMNQLC